jgi:CRISPR-associated protein Csb2
MPLGVLDKGREKTTLVLDTWARLEGEPLIVQWDADLSIAERSTLHDLVQNLAYLGRSESWTEARLLDRSMAATNGNAVVPCDDRPNPGRGWEQVALLAPLPGADYAAWREAAIREASSEFAVKKKLTKSDQKKIAAIEADFPADLISCLQVETGWLKKTGWSQPPGTRRVFYWRRSDALEVSVLTSPRRRRSMPVEAVLLSMATESGNDHALPSVTRTLPQAEMLHRALISILSRQDGRSVALSGRDDDGLPLQSAHRHAHVIPLDLDDDGHLDHILVWAPMGLDAAAQDAVRAMRLTFTKGGSAPLRLALAAEGTIRDISTLKGQHGETFRRLLGPANVWRSRTPFVPPRFVKKSGRNTIEGQLLAECESRGLTSPSQVHVIHPTESPVFLRHRHYVRKRRRGPAPPVDAGLSVELRFDAPVSGLIVLGYASHFGLGLFEALQ